MKIRVIAPVAALALVLSLAGCGGDSANATDTSATHSTDATATSTSTSTDDAPMVGAAAPAGNPAADIDLSSVTWVDKTGEDEVTIQVRDNTFLPGYVVVTAGTPITFLNVGRTEHNALPVDEISFVGIEADQLIPRGEATITIDEPGDFPYYCSLHGTTSKGMVGAIRVVA